ncbi:MAG: phosphohistidine phosphatase SixA [Acidobacteriota bacterium]
MQVYIVRHGIAEDYCAQGDAYRALTDEGRKRMCEVAAGLVTLRVSTDKILSSPLVRAKQTADIIADAMKMWAELMDELAPGHTPDEVCTELAQFEDCQGIMLVGHQPNCSELASYLLAGSDDLDLEFKKGAVCLIDTPKPAPGAGTLAWLYPPKVLRSIAKNRAV